MAAFSRQDNQLLTESYSLQLLKESFPQMTLAQVVANLDEFNNSESIWVEQFSEKIIEELFGGLKALAGVGGSAAAKAGGGLLQKGKDLASGAINGVKQAGARVGDNVKDIYKSAEDQSKFTQGAKQAQASALQLVQLVKDAQAKGLVTFKGDPLTMPLGELVQELILAQQGSKQLAGSAQKRGVFNKVGQSFGHGFQS